MIHAGILSLRPFTVSKQAWCFIFFRSSTALKSCSREDLLAEVHMKSVTSTGWAGTSLKSSGECWGRVRAIQVNEEAAQRKGEQVDVGTGVWARVAGMCRVAGAVHVQGTGQVQG